MEILILSKAKGRAAYVRITGSRLVCIVVLSKAKLLL
jgi:hypothetical protein